MAEKCLRNASCTCSMCAGFDVASLMSISKSISSNIKYEDEESEGSEAPAPPAPKFGGVANSPPVPSQKKTFVANSPPLAAVKRPPPAPVNVHMATAVEDVTMTDVGTVEASKDTQMDNVEATLSNMEVNTGGQAGTVSLDAVLPKLTDKNWKLRKEGFEELKSLLEQSGVKTNQVRPAMELFPKMCEDANASAMEAGIAAVLAYTVNVEPFDKEIVAGVMTRVTDKGFSARPGIVKLCTELTDAFIAAGAAEETVGVLLEGTNNRKPKVPPACATCILDALKEYGPRVVPLQAIKTALPKLLEGAVKVRPIAMSIMVEIHRWTGPALVQDIVSSLRQAQQTEFEEQTKDVTPGQAAPTKFVRGAKPAKAAGAGGKASTAASGAVEPAAAAFDPRDFAETVDLLAKLPKSDFKTKLALPKWSEKVEALKIVLELIGPVPKLANGDYYELVSTLKPLTNDSNVNIVAKSIEVLGALADGLRKNFTQYARTMFPDLLRKLSDKKSVILNATNKTLDLFLQHAMTIDMMMDDLKIACDASKNKAPPARVQTMGFLTRAVETRNVDLNDKALIVSFGAMFMKGIDDTDPKVREAGQNSFTVLLQANDQTAGWLQNMMDSIARKNPRAFKTIQRGLGGGAASTPTSRPGSAQSSRPGTPSRPGSAAPSRPSSAGSVASRSSFGGSKASEPDVDIEMDAPAPAGPGRPSLKKRGPPSRLGTKPGTPKAPTRKPTAAGSSTGPSAGGSVSTDFTPMAISVTAEEAEEIIDDLHVENWTAIQEGFASSKWMERKSAIEGLEEYARAQSNMMSMRVIEAFTIYLSKQVKDFKDSNINVLKSSFQAVGTFAETAATKFPRGVVCLVTPRACDKIGDRKANEAIRNMIMQFCEATSPSYTTGCMVEYMPKVRLPLAHIEALSVLSDCVKDFGVSICNPRALIDFSKGPQGLESSNPKVRSAATSLLSTMYSQLGPALLPILNLDSWKPALAKTVEEEFQKVGFDPANAMASVKRQVKDQDEAPAAADPGALFGRVDVSAQITKELLEDMKNEKDKLAWKKRQEAMINIQAICEGAGCAIEFTRPVQEALRILKARLNDSNANLKVKAANVIGVVATSVGPDIGKMSKILGATLIAGVGDNKKTMQTAAVQALHCWVRHNNETSTACMEKLLSPLSEGLLNTVGRAELLGWAAEHLQKCEKIDLSCLVGPTVQCMMDKSSEAREKAQILLVEVMKSVGKDTVFTTGCRDIKPAAMRALKPMLQKVSDTVEATGNASATTSIPPVAPTVTGPGTTTGTPGRSGLQRRASASASGGTPVKSRLTRPGSLRAPMTSSSAISDSSAKDTAPLLKMSNNKPARILKGQYNRWIFETTSVGEMNSRKGELEVEWKPFLSAEFHAKLFAPSLEKGMLAAMDELTLCIVHQADEVISSLDLVLKWCTLRIVDNNVQALAKLLEVLVKLFEMLKDAGYHLDDVEAAILLPYLLQESGQSKPRFRVRFRDVMKLVVDVYNPEKYVPFLMECFNGSKNMKSRCECIDLVEYIVSVHGYNVLGRKCIKDVGKYVVAHEKELRESAINALIAVYKRTEGVFKVFPLHQQNRKSYQIGTYRNNNGLNGQDLDLVSEPPPVVESTSMGGVQSDPHDSDVDMGTPDNDNGEEISSSAAIEELLLRPIELLINSSKEIVAAGTPAYKEGGNALKGLYAIINRPSDPSEIDFLHSYVNEIVLALCDCIHGAFYAGNAEKRPEMYILAISITTLTVVFNSDAVTSMQRYTVERVLLELCSKIMDPRMEKFSEKANMPASEIATLAPEEKRYLMVFKALYKAMRKLTERAKPGDVYPSVINLLQRLMHNDVGDYNKNDTLKHLLKEDSLDQLVGRILLKLSTVQANSLTPFEGIDIFGVLMQMHIAFEASMKDVPPTSPVRQALEEMGVGQAQQNAAEATGLQYGTNGNGVDHTVRNSPAAPRVMNHFGGINASTNGGEAAPEESLNRRLFPPRDSSITTRTARTTSAAPSFAGNALSGETRGRSFTSFNDFTANRGASSNAARPSTSAQLDNLRERLQMSRHFN
ncbi:Cytoskeleton-associated protein [Phytophthora megakarya]|uniref:Cytoskeleton-associated protein n=1 Tax=Phytophthora megakarya TaxID=4795 RepID=A0A225W549_9STRA|nr:Cytoskeleton-associated protein [Phytophthora megakarya]